MRTSVIIHAFLFVGVGVTSWKGVIGEGRPQTHYLHGKMTIQTLPRTPRGGGQKQNITRP